MKEPRRTGIVLKPDKEFVYLPTKHGYLQIPKYSKPLPTKNGYVQFVYRGVKNET